VRQCKQQYVVCGSAHSSLRLSSSAAVRQCVGVCGSVRAAVCDSTAWCDSAGGWQCAAVHHCAAVYSVYGSVRQLRATGCVMIKIEYYLNYVIVVLKWMDGWERAVRASSLVDSCPIG
jgi:hypothetical protein